MSKESATEDSVSFSGFGKTEEIMWGFSSAGRAPALQAGGQRFDPANLHHFFKELTEVPTEVETSLNFLGSSNMHLEN